MASRIFLISQTESILTNRGKRHPDLAKYLVENSYEVYYLSSNYYHAYKRHFLNAEIAVANRKVPYTLEIIKVPAYKKNISVARLYSNLIFAFKTYSILKKNIEDGDIVIVPSRPIEILYFIAALKKRTKLKVILDIRDIWPDAFQIEKKLLKAVFNWYCDFFLRHSVKKFDIYVHIAPSFINWLNRYSEKATSSFVPLGWETSRWEGKVTNNLHMPERNYYLQLVCVAQLQFQIDVRPVLNFLKNNHTYHLTIIGENGSGERYNEVLDYIRQNDLRNVTIIGAVGRDEIVEYLGKADIGLVPMISSSLPNKVFDYLGAKLPIIVLGENDSADFVNKYSIGWSCKYDSDSFSTMMLTISKEEVLEKRDSVLKIRMQFSRDNLHKEFFNIITQ